MKFTLSWLKDHLETEKTLEKILDTLTAIGLEVEEVDDRTALAPFVIARVLVARRHPDADKLQILDVDTGDERPVQVVCGGHNACAGLVGVFAPPGTYIPGSGITLAVGKIRGIESYGMMCSERELLLSDKHDGIISLPSDAPVGTSFATYAGLNDPLVNVGLTPDRADCTNVRGIARDLAAAGIGKLKKPVAPAIREEETENAVTVIINSCDQKPLSCSGFSWREVKNVKNGAAPEWMKQRLSAIGLKPVNALVDITNYLTFDQGRPLHVFDADKVRGNLVVRSAHAGEKILALNGKEYTLSPENCVIADDNGVVSIAGIIGGENTGCDENTRNVIIESALWDPVDIARTGRKLGIISDARYRFERGIDPASMVSGLELATGMICDICGGTPLKAGVTGFKLPVTRKIRFPFSEIKRLTGLDVPVSEARSILIALGFLIEGSGDTITVEVPTWRVDICEKADLVAEVMRIYGIDKIKPQPLPTECAKQKGRLPLSQIRSYDVRRTLAGRAMMEVVTWSFISEKASRIFGGGQPELKLSNPIAADMSSMRPSLLPGLISASRRNASRGFADLAFFEVSDIYKGNTPRDQHLVAGGIRCGTAKLAGSGRFWSGDTAIVNVFDAKADALSVLEACGISTDRTQIEKSTLPWYHPGRSGLVRLGPGITLGHFGELHPEISELFDIDYPLCGFEVFLDTIPAAKKKATRVRPPLVLFPLQTVTRDFAFVVDKTVSAANIIRATTSADKKLIRSVRIFDLFEGGDLEAGKKSIAIEVSIQPVNNTLTDDNLKMLSKKIIDNVIKITNGALRY